MFILLYPTQFGQRVVFTGLFWLLTIDILYLIVHRKLQKAEFPTIGAE